MRPFDRHSLAIAGLLLAIAFCVFGAYMSQKTYSDFRRECVERGGVPFTPRHGWICLKKGALQP